MPRRSNARARLVATAADLFQRQGFHGVGLAQILAESAAPKGSFYHHFPEGKEQLAEAAVLSSGAELTRLVETSFAAAPSFEAGARALAAAVARWFQDSGYSAGCPVTSVLLETVPESERLRTACKHVFDACALAVADHARRLGRAENADRLGAALVIALEGAWVLSRAVQSTEPFDIAADMVVGLSG